jgi:PAS domain S-box-containing protein
MISWLWPLAAMPLLAAAALMNNLLYVRLAALAAAGLLAGWGLWLARQRRVQEQAGQRLRQDIKQIKEELHQQRLNNLDLMRLKDRNEEAQRNLEHQMEQRQQILKTLPAALILADHDAKITYGNSRVEELTGWKVGDLLGRNWNEVFNQPGPSTVPREKALEEAERYDNEQDQIKSQDGREVLISSHYWRLPQQKGLGWLFVTRSQAVDYDRLKDEFVTNISHELRTPLTVIKGYAEILYEEAAAANQPRAELLKIIVDEGERLSAILDGIINYRQASMGQIGLRHENVDIVKLLNLVAADMEPAAVAKGVKLVRKIPESLSPCKGDFTALRFAFSHILDNAIKFTPEGGTVTVETGGWRLEDALWKLEVHITDTGVGISPNDLPHIFDRFYRTDQKVHTKQGTGIGLSVVKEIVQTHSGTISVESELGKGSRFTVRLPMTD